MSEYGHILTQLIKNLGMGIHNINRDLNKTTYTVISKTNYAITMYFWVFLDRLY